MSNAELSVGDRVIVSAGECDFKDGCKGFPTVIGEVTCLTKQYVSVKCEGSWHPPEIRVHYDRVTVVDREPVEWPEGFSKSTLVGMVRVGGVGVVNRKEFDLIRSEAGDYVAENWPKLVGGDS